MEVNEIVETLKVLRSDLKCCRTEREALDEAIEILEGNDTRLKRLINNINDCVLLEGKKKGIDEFCEDCIKEISFQHKSYLMDRKNIPKPDITTAVGVLTVKAEIFKEKIDEDYGRIISRMV